MLGVSPIMKAWASVAERREALPPFEGRNLVPHRRDKLSVAEEIRRVIADAIKDGGCVDAAVNASIIARAYPRCGLTTAQITERVIEAAVAARVALQLSKRSFANG